MSCGSNRDELYPPSENELRYREYMARQRKNDADKPSGTMHVDVLRSLPGEAIAAVARWIETTPERFFVMDSERRILQILADDMRHFRFTKE